VGGKNVISQEILKWWDLDWCVIIVEKGDWMEEGGRWMRCENYGITLYSKQYHGVVSESDIV
jgi:hypothetical protein